jgi:hypothetical protein
MMPFGVDVLGTLSQKLKQLMNETQANQRLFIDLTKLYREDKINEKDFFSKILNYVVTFSALNFLMVRVILELRSALEKGTTIKDASGGVAPSSSPAQSAGFGISSFISSVGTLRQEHTVPAPQSEDAFLSRKMEIGSPSTMSPSKTCKECGTVLPILAKFCGTCGDRQENDLH